MLVIFDFSQTHAYLDLKFKSLQESCGTEILSHQQILIDLVLVLCVQNDFRILYTETKICIFLHN